MFSMSDKEEREISRIKEVESTNLARDDIRELVIETKKAVEKDNDLLANRVHRNFLDNNIKYRWCYRGGKDSSVRKDSRKVNYKISNVSYLWRYNYSSRCRSHRKV